MSLVRTIQSVILYREAHLDGLDEKVKLYHQLGVIAELHAGIHVCPSDIGGSTDFAADEDEEGYRPCPTLLRVAEAVGVFV